MAAGNPGVVIPQRYRDAIPDADPIVLQSQAPKRVAKLIRGLTEKQMGKKPAPGKWSIREIVAHLADGEVILGSRVRFIATHDRPQIMGYDQDAFVERLGTEKAKTADLLAAFAGVRSANVALLKRLPQEAFARVGLHSERGEESIEAMVAMYAGHDKIHEQQIETVRLALFPPVRKRAVSKARPAAKSKRSAAEKMKTKKRGSGR